MEVLRKNVLDISNNYYDFCMNLENVKGIGFGFKSINGIGTLEPCIHVLVEKKVDCKYLSKDNVIPKFFMGIKTDVIEIGKGGFRYNSIFPMKLRPLKGGCDIATIYEKDDVYGTLACIVSKKKLFKKEYFILSNNHVLADINKLPIGTPIIQPSKSSILNIENEVIANLFTFVKLKVYDGNKKNVNYVDCALAKINNNIGITRTIFDVGEIKGVSTPKLGARIKKYGASSGLSRGKITTIDATFEIEQEGNKYMFKNQVLADIFNISGDSGSLILNEFNEAVGLFWGGSDNNSVAYINDISTVLKNLNVSLYTI